MRVLADRIRQRRGKRASVIAAGLAVSMMALAGCASAQPASEDGAGADCETTTPVRIMMGTSNLDISFAPYASLANNLGYFADECLDVEVSSTGGSISTAQALIGGQTDVTIMVPDSMIVAADTEERLPMKIFYNLLPRFSYEIAVAKDSGIDGYEDLKGGTIAVPVISDSNTAFIAAVLKDEGISLDEVEIIATGYGAASAEALISGEADAFLGWPANWPAFAQAGYELTVLPAPSWLNDYYGMGLAALDTYIEENPEVLEGVSRAVARATVFLKENPEEVVRLFWEEYPERAPLPTDDEEQALANELAVLDATAQTMRLADLEIDTMWGEQTEEKWNRQIQYNLNAGLIEKASEPELFFTNEFNEAANDFDRDAVVEDAKAAAEADSK